MNELDEIQIFAKTLSEALVGSSYSIGNRSLSGLNSVYYIPDIIIFQDEIPFIIIEFKRLDVNEWQFNKYLTKMAKVQDCLGVPWSILVYGDIYYLRHIGKDYKEYRFINEIAEVIEKSKIRVNTLESDKCFNEIMELFKDAASTLLDNQMIDSFITNLEPEDFIITNNYIRFNNGKENAFFKSLLSVTNKNDLFRYTSRDNLFKILQSRQQNMVSINCMNDISEINYADNYIAPVEFVLKESIEEGNRIFILSCCDESMSDDLMMWRLYAQNAEGVSLNYHIDNDKIDNEYFYLANISYGQENGTHKELEFVKEILNWRRREEKDEQRFVFLKWRVWKHFFKSYHFHYEKEIRLIYFEHEHSLATGTQWIEDYSNGIASPMKLFSLDYTSNLKFPLSLRMIIIGPKCKCPMINIHQYEQLFKESHILDSGSEVEVKASRIKIYR